MKTKKIAILTGLLCLIGLSSLSARTFLKTKDGKIEDEQGQEIILRGMGLGGWMLQEGYMLRFPGEGTQHSIKQRIAGLIGDQECERFYDQWLKNHMTKADVDAMAKWGFNSIRLPMHYNLFTLPIEKEPEANTNTWLTKGFQMTDSLLSWCKSNNMYLILDLHAAPGGQGNDANISDLDTSKPSLWQSEQNKNKTVALWRKIAEHYANDPYIAGYDILNEPNWTFEGKNKNGVNDLQNKELWALYQDITKAIREVDQKHIIIIEGNGWGNNYNGFPGPWDNNMVFSFHKYWNANGQADIRQHLALREKYKMPLWLGESGENSNKWFRDCISLVEANGIGWSWWPLKKLGGVNNPYSVNIPAGYDKILNYWRTQEDKPSREFASKVLFELTDNLKAANCRYNPDVVDAMFRQVNDSTTRPFKANAIPGRIYGVDFDLGKYNQAYADKDNERINGSDSHPGGNKAGGYRNDGVDIERSTDQVDNPDGFQVTSIENNEWLKYTVDVRKKGIYSIKVRVLPSKQNDELHLTLDNKPVSQKVSIASMPENEGKWLTLNAGKVKLSKGMHTVKVCFDKGAFKFNYFEFRLR